MATTPLLLVVAKAWVEAKTLLLVAMAWVVAATPLLLVVEKARVEAKTLLVAMAWVKARTPLLRVVARAWVVAVTLSSVVVAGGDKKLMADAMAYGWEMAGILWRRVVVEQAMPAGDVVVALAEGGVVPDGVDEVVEEEWDADEEAANWLNNDLSPDS